MTTDVAWGVELPRLSSLVRVLDRGRAVELEEGILGGPRIVCSAIICTVIIRITGGTG